HVRILVDASTLLGRLTWPFLDRFWLSSSFSRCSVHSPRNGSTIPRLGFRGHRTENRTCWLRRRRLRMGGRTSPESGRQPTANISKTSALMELKFLCCRGRKPFTRSEKETCRKAIHRSVVSDTA